MDYTLDQLLHRAPEAQDKAARANHFGRVRAPAGSHTGIALALLPAHSPTLLRCLSMYHGTRATSGSACKAGRPGSTRVSAGALVACCAQVGAHAVACITALGSSFNLLPPALADVLQTLKGSAPAAQAVDVD